MKLRRNYRLSAASRAQVLKAVEEAPNGAFVDIHEQPTRTLEQNNRFWSLLDDIAEQAPWRDWQGKLVHMTSEEWKCFFIAILFRDQRMVMNPEGTGMVLVGSHTGSSKMKVAEMHDLQTLIEAFGAERGVRFRVHRESNEKENPNA